MERGRKKRESVGKADRTQQGPIPADQDNSGRTSKGKTIWIGIIASSGRRGSPSKEGGKAKKIPIRFRHAVRS